MARPPVPSTPVMRDNQTAREWVKFFTTLVRRPKEPPVSQTVGASPSAFTAQTDGSFIINGGTVSAVSLARDDWSVALGPNANPVPVLVGDVVTVTYSSLPIITFLGG